MTIGLLIRHIFIISLYCSLCYMIYKDTSIIQDL